MTRLEELAQDLSPSPAPGYTVEAPPPSGTPAPGQALDGTGEIERKSSPLENEADRLARLDTKAQRGFAVLAGDRLVEAAEVAVRVRETAHEVGDVGRRARRHVIRGERLVQAFEKRHAVRAEHAAAGIELELEAARGELDGELRKHLEALCDVNPLDGADRARLVLLAAGAAVERELRDRLDALACEAPELFSPLSFDEFADRLAGAAAGVSQAKAAVERVSEQFAIAERAMHDAEALVGARGALGEVAGRAASPRGLSGRERDEIMGALGEHERVAADALAVALEAEREGAATYRLVEAALRGEPPAERKAGRS